MKMEMEMELIKLVQQQQSVRLYNIMTVLTQILHEIKNKGDEELFNRLFNVINKTADVVIAYLEMINETEKRTS